MSCPRWAIPRGADDRASRCGPFVQTVIEPNKVLVAVPKAPKKRLP